MPSRIEDYGLIGDLRTGALVGKDGSIDWMCLPRFDSGACFAALLGAPEHGRWIVAPTNPAKEIKRRYRKDTLILETDFETERGSVRVTDFMPPHQPSSHVIRMIEGLRGTVDVHMELILRFDYGKLAPWVTRLDDGALRAVAGPNMVILRSSADVSGKDLTTVSDFPVSAGQTEWFMLSYFPSHLPIPKALNVEKLLEQTNAFWTQWTAKCTYEGPYEEAVKRSLITLKALTYWPTGGITAAATTSLPEKIGGVRNWDYRCCWLRDASLALRVLQAAGYHEEAEDWRDWLVRAAAGSPDQVQVMYGMAGESFLKEWELDWLPGYEGSKPVRIGNAAVEQLQLDVYGELSGVMYHARNGEMSEHEQGIELEWALLEHLEKIWREPDEGIWEVRGSRNQFIHSKVMAWYAFDSAIKSAEQFGLNGPVDRWRAVRDEIHAEVCRDGFNPVAGTFVQFYGSDNVDASLLAIPKTGFLPIDDPRVQGTIRAIERDLIRDGFVMRYDTHQTDDGLPPGEGVFLPCSFWLAGAYALSGRLDDAKTLFERILALRNDLGLLSEEYDPAAKRMLGNFPQAFSHVSLLDAAFLLTRLECEHGVQSQSIARDHVDKP